MDRTELGATLRTWRERLHPADVGLPAGVRHRTPGLRREEVTGPAGMSVDYLSRLEQGRGPRPSDGVLTAPARALRVTDTEREHLFSTSPGAPRRCRGGSAAPCGRACCGSWTASRTSRPC